MADKVESVETVELLQVVKLQTVGQAEQALILEKVEMVEPAAELMDIPQETEGMVKTVLALVT
jgi:hypothetical protein